jgi:hypothetical protein
MPPRRAFLHLGGQRSVEDTGRCSSDLFIHITSAPKGYSYLPNTLHRAIMVWSKLLPALSVGVAEIRRLSSGRRWTAGDGPPVNF